MGNHLYFSLCVTFSLLCYSPKRSAVYKNYLFLTLVRQFGSLANSVWIVNWNLNAWRIAWHFGEFLQSFHEVGWSRFSLSGRQKNPKIQSSEVIVLAWGGLSNFQGSLMVTLASWPFRFSLKTVLFSFSLDILSTLFHKDKSFRKG